MGGQTSLYIGGGFGRPTPCLCSVSKDRLSRPIRIDQPARFIPNAAKTNTLKIQNSPLRWWGPVSGIQPCLCEKKTFIELFLFFCCSAGAHPPRNGRKKFQKTTSATCTWGKFVIHITFPWLPRYRIGALAEMDGSFRRRWSRTRIIIRNCIGEVATKKKVVRSEPSGQHAVSFRECRKMRKKTFHPGFLRSTYQRFWPTPPPFGLHVADPSPGRNLFAWRGK